MTPIQHLQNLQSQLSRLALCEQETANSELKGIDQLAEMVRANAYNEAFDMVQKTINAIEDEQFSELMNNVNTWKRSTRLPSPFDNVMTTKMQSA